MVTGPAVAPLAVDSPRSSFCVVAVVTEKAAPLYGTSEIGVIGSLHSRDSCPTALLRVPDNGSCVARHLPLDAK
jgi:hypothetical protein